MSGEIERHLMQKIYLIKIINENSIWVWLNTDGYSEENLLQHHIWLIEN